jgi:hypothetical protein
VCYSTVKKYLDKGEEENRGASPASLSNSRFVKTNTDENNL